MKLKITILLSLLALGLVSAQEKKWSIEECVAYALENNLTIAQLQLQLENTKIGESDAFGNFLPSLNASSNGSWNRGSGFDQTTNERISGTFFSLNGGVSSGVTLFDGLRNVNTLQRAKLSTIASQYQLDDMKDDIVLNVANSYLQVLSSKEALKAIELQITIANEEYERTKELVDAGVLPKGNLLELEATIATLEQQQVSGENNVLLNRLFLAQLLQITDYENFDIADESYEVPPSDVFNYSANEIYGKALSYRSDIKLAETNIEIAEKDVKIAKGALYPRLGASIGYNTSYSSFVRKLSGANFGDQLTENDGIGYGMNLSIPIFNGFSVKNGIKRSKINLESSKLRATQDKLALEANVNQAYLDVRSFAKSYEAAQKTLAARKLAFDFAKERYNVELMNAFDYSQAQSRLDNAEIDVIRAKYDYIFRIKILEIYFGLPITLE
ncbi:TolC family protein [Cellulophaga sp. F20128]|uniref:TolC family protein n=1 Tax=Cellulophaga sp. F20128 TaxID=2926413 RepID=UPI001FF64820|nr:TolC family protein [Cellulophaga sp. F20128]MCK0155548.1 TolC family protein [Cellulophaga sp. F20128]